MINSFQTSREMAFPIRGNPFAVVERADRTDIGEIDPFAVFGFQNIKSGQVRFWRLFRGVKGKRGGDFENLFYGRDSVLTV